MKTSLAFISCMLAASSAAYRISLYSETDYQGRQATYTTNGVHAVGFTVHSWIYDSPPGDGCCIAFCRGTTNVGRYCDSARKSDSSAGVTRVVTGCGSQTLNC